MEIKSIKTLSRLLTVGALAAALTIPLGCDLGTEFREAAQPMVESGVKDIVDGLMEGFFAAIEVDNKTTGASSTSGQ